MALVSGCYYGHLASGQMRMLLARESIDDLQADPGTPDQLRAQLVLVERTRLYASELGLEVGQQYTSYVDWPGDRIVTTVVAARPGHVEAAGFDFPIVGKVPYKGFFDREAAEEEAESLRAEGLDVCVVAVTAYSTLGWLDDPITAPMLRSEDAKLVETVLHELVHTTVFVASQPAFNEGVARFIGQEAAIRFFADDPTAEAAARARVGDDRAIAAALLGFRDAIATLYRQEEDAVRRSSERERLETEFRASLGGRSFATRDAGPLAERLRLNDACLALGGTYAADTDKHVLVLSNLRGDLQRFVERLRDVADADDPRAAFFANIEPRS